ncbi:MAG: Mur ligase family protein, partial [Planctomycetota bacterium]
ISSILAAMVRNRCSHAVLEVSSHALHQGRTAGLRFDVAIFTNLSGDHLDYHGTMEAYAAAKARLFEQLPSNGIAVVNADDPWSLRMIRDTRAGIICCRRVGREPRLSEDTTGGRGDASSASTWAQAAVAHECSVEVLRSGLVESDVRFIGPWGEFTAPVRLPGDHNAMNMLQAIAAVWWALKLNGTPIKATVLAELVSAGEAPAGRLQPVSAATEDADGTLPSSSSSEPLQVPAPAVLVDYAHTDDALANALDSVRAVLRKGQRLGVVFGCGGDRDRGKRPRMARVACDRADFVCLTSDNPRTEDPVAIVGEILTGVPDHFDRAHLLIEPDRRRAIEKAIKHCRAEDVLVIAGKGHEDYQIVGTTRRPFDDRVIAGLALRRWLETGGSTTPSRRPTISQRELKSGQPSSSPRGHNDRSLAM